MPLHRECTTDHYIPMMNVAELAKPGDYFLVISPPYQIPDVIRTLDRSGLNVQTLCHLTRPRKILIPHMEMINCWSCLSVAYKPPIQSRTRVMEDMIFEERNSNSNMVSYQRDPETHLVEYINLIGTKGDRIACVYAGIQIDFKVAHQLFDQELKANRQLFYFNLCF
ncbi:hypothetical protein [Geminocystis sp. NIES-3708]|uniref:hypothetical protein n=1 Tax=Geminocystis sp. NIES-3708 TaxID=1615909 RepID=UPI0011875C5C|nr:hypothetical protein [Geminocystis sp. NIES-3708]